MKKCWNTGKTSTEQITFTYPLETMKWTGCLPTTSTKRIIKKKAKCLFVREQEGVYSFFSKRVIMKAEQNKLVIRVGGGFMSVDDFIELNNPWE